MTFFELMYAALVWGVKRAGKVDMDVEAIQGYMGHLAYVCMHATMGNYTDEAYRGYDGAIRDKAKDKGLKAFRMGDNGLSLLHFNLDNSRAHKDMRKRATTGTNRSTPAAAEGKAVGPCNAHNFDKGGCVRKACRWIHQCSVCKSPEHVAEACTNKKY